MNEFSAQSIKGLVDFGDKLIEQLKLQDNELVKKSSDGIKDLLKQSGLLKNKLKMNFRSSIKILVLTDSYTNHFFFIFSFISVIFNPISFMEKLCTRVRQF